MKKSQMVTAVAVHPHTLRYLKSGHPWVTKDSFTARFPREAVFLRPKLTQNDGHFVLLPDPHHSNIKARLWKFIPGQWMDYNKGAFKIDCRERLLKALHRRLKENIPSERQNWYWVFGEADQMPGLFIQYLGDVIWIQIYSQFWSRWYREIVGMLRDIVALDFPKTNISPPSLLCWQVRLESVEEKKSQMQMVQWKDGAKQNKEHHWQVMENGLLFNMTLGDRYDGGLYTDMAQIRKSLEAQLFAQKKVLNLFSYTGAFSLFALKHGAADVISVDLSPWALERLEENINLNIAKNNLPSNAMLLHHSWRMNVKNAILDLITRKENVDLIICDPPPVSSDGKKKQGVADFYRETLPLMKQILSPKGKILAACNLHHQTKAQWEKQLLPMLEKNKLKQLSKLSLSGDCPISSAFPEGDYLKISLISHADLS